jgi:phospholipid transport system substrate-binding protein
MILRYFQIWRFFLLFVVGSASVASLAAERLIPSTPVDVDADSPYLLIEKVTAQVLAKIETHRPKINASVSAEEKARRFNCFFNDIEATLSHVIDFNWIARNVMGPYGKLATPSQREAFALAFRNGLVETYGRGLLSYTDQEIRVLASEDYAEKRKVSVRQEIRSADGNFPLEYTMGLSKSGQWRIINVIINGINLGKTFRNQFVQASQKNGGDIDAVIADWGSQSI